MIELFEDNPVIPGVISDADVELVLKNEAKIVFTLYGDIADIANIIKPVSYTHLYHVCMGYTLDDMITGIRIMHDVMSEGYKPSVARLYDAEDGKEHFSHFAAGKCVILFVTEGPERISKANAEGIKEIVGKYPECMEVDHKLIDVYKRQASTVPSIINMVGPIMNNTPSIAK